jgi:photosystem II stability/assembly factor-like uncharacterized protein
MLRKITLIAAILANSYFFAQWTSITSGTQNDLKSVTFTNATTGFAVGLGGTVLKTTDGGTNWTTVTTPMVQDIYSVLFLDESNGLILGDGGKILKTTDGGANWSFKVSGTSNPLYTSCKAGTVIFAAGASGTILKSINSGDTWTSVSSGTAEDINAIEFDAANTSIGYFVGNNASISYAYKTSNGGDNWSPQTLPANNVVSFFGISVISDMNVVFCGGVSKILKTTDGGSNWSNQNNTAANFYRDVLFISPTNGYVVGGAGKIIATTNGGTSYTTETSGVSSILNSITRTTCGNMFVVGNGGVILKKGVSVTGAADNYTTSQATPLIVTSNNGVLANDGQSNVTVNVMSNVSNGTLVLNADGSFTYTPDPGYTGNDEFTYVINDNCGNTSAPVTVNINSTASVGELVNGKFVVSPNPFVSSITLSGVEEIKDVTIFNVQGEILFYKNKPTVQLDLSALSPGIYMLRIVTGSGELVQRITKL